LRPRPKTLKTTTPRQFWKKTSSAQEDVFFVLGAQMIAQNCESGILRTRLRESGGNRIQATIIYGFSMR
jgi:hypothetical protein